MALTVKFLVTLVAAYLTLILIGRATLGQAFIIALVGTAVNYLLGDLVILPAAGNIVASVSDGLVAAVLAFLVMYFWATNTNTVMNYSSLLWFAVVVAVFEYFFHNYLKRSEEVAP